MIRQAPGWWPREGRATCLTRIALGTLIAYDRRAYRLIETAERPIDLWPEHFHRAWEIYQAQCRSQGRTAVVEEWPERPIVVVLQPDGEPAARARHRQVSAGEFFHTLPEHYGVCHRCGELPPCREYELDQAVASAAQRMAALMAIPPGHCLGCGEAITHRMNAHRFPGPNLLRPDLGEDSAVFHARRACRDAAYAYDELWAKAAPGRRRRFACDGHRIAHQDGSRECSAGRACPEADGPLGWPVSHVSFTTHDARWTTPNTCWCIETTPQAGSTAGGGATDQPPLPDDNTPPPRAQTADQRPPRRQDPVT